LREYEFTFVVQPEITDEGVQAISQRFEGILGNHGSEKLFYEDWGRRRLAYEIKNFQKATTRSCAS
jgi:small subunit ribosomal protein S6